MMIRNARISLFKRLFISIFLIAIVGTHHTAGAQTPSPGPVFPAIDGNGVDLTNGSFTIAQTDVAIGQHGNGGLTFTRYYRSDPNASGSGYWTHNHNGYIVVNGGACTVVMGAMTEIFPTCTSTNQRGASITYDSSAQTYTFVSEDGSSAVFLTPSPNVGMLNMPSPLAGYLFSTTSPDGEIVQYVYESGTPICYPSPEYCFWSVTVQRLASVYNNLGYRLAFEFSGPPEFVSLPNRVTGINYAAEYCSGWNCSLSWPFASYTVDNGRWSSASNALNQTTTYTYSGILLTRVQSPYSGSLAMDIGYSAGRVSSIHRGYTSWTYGYSDSGGNRTTTVTNVDATVRSYTSSIASGRILSVTNELGKTTGYLYDGANRQTRVTLPEGNYV